MSESKGTNTLNVILGEFSRQGVNIIKLLESIDSLVSGGQDFVTVTLTNDDGSTIQKKLPSIGKIQKDVQALYAMLDDLYDFKNNEVFVISNGVKHPVFIPDYPYLLAPPSNLSKTEYVYKNKMFYTRLYMSNIEKHIKYKKYAINVANDVFNDINITSENELILYLTNNNIPYELEEDLLRTNPGKIKFDGSFFVLSNIKNVYKLNSLSYTNISNETYRLKLNDVVFFKNTELRIDEINYDTNEIKVTTTKGYDSLGVGTELKYLSPFENSNFIDLPCTIDQKYFAFIKNVNDTFNVESLTYSIPIKIDVSTLKSNETNITEFNVNQVVKNQTVPRSLGLVPNAPTLNADDLQVRRINDHLYQDSLVTSITNKVSRKNELSSEITEIDKAIDEKKSILASTEELSQNKRISIENDLNSLVNKRKIKSNEYSSIINELGTLNSDQVKSISPKYRVRGFFNIPQELYTDITGTQNIVQFIVSYRYKGKNQNTTQSQNFTNTDTNGNKTFGTFSDWIEVYSKQRIKVIDQATGDVIWEEQKTSDGQQININQIDIPITKGEMVEIRARSISEAGFPTEPLLSGWSNVIEIPFPDELTDTNSLSDIIQRSLSDDAQLLVDNAIAAKGLDVHIANSVTISDKYFAHKGDEIGSGIYDTNGNLLTVEQVLKNYQTEISGIKNVITNTIPELKVDLIAPDGTEIKLTKNSLNKIFAGYYVDDIKNIPVAGQNGATIVKEYQLRLYTESGSSIYLRSGIHGSIGQDLDLTYELASDRKYQNVPILINESNTNFSYSKKGQFIYPRYKDYSLITDFYNDWDELASEWVGINEPYKWYVGNEANSFQQKEWGISYLPDFGADADNRGAYLYPKVNTSNDIYIGAPDYGSVLELKTGKENAIKIPLVFTYRLTDTNGDLANSGTNIEYRKRLGIDIFLYQLNTISLDFELSCKYDRDTF